MRDHNGNKIELGMVLKIIDHPEIFSEDLWILYDWVEMSALTYLVLKNCSTCEIRIFESKDVERL